MPSAEAWRVGSIPVLHVSALHMGFCDKESRDHDHFSAGMPFPRRRRYPGSPHRQWRGLAVINLHANERPSALRPAQLAMCAGARWAVRHRRLCGGTRPGDGTACGDRAIQGTVDRVRHCGANVRAAVPGRFRSHREPIRPHSSQAQAIHRISLPRRCPWRAQQTWNRVVPSGSRDRALEVQRHDQLVDSCAGAGLGVKPPVVVRQRPRHGVHSRGDAAWVVPVLHAGEGPAAAGFHAGTDRLLAAPGWR